MNRKVCMNCLLVSNNHTESCKRCGYVGFGNIDDYWEQEVLNTKNLRVVQQLKDESNKIERECKKFTKEWDSLWGSDQDTEFKLISVLDQNDYSYLSDSFD